MSCSGNEEQSPLLHLSLVEAIKGETLVEIPLGVELPGTNLLGKARFEKESLSYMRHKLFH